MSAGYQLERFKEASMRKAKLDYIEYVFAWISFMRDIDPLGIQEEGT